MSSRRRRGDPVKTAVVIGSILLGLLLAANLVMGMQGVLAGESRPGGFLDDATLLAGGFWLPMSIGMLLCLLGSVWISKAHFRSERSSLLWLRRGLLLGLAGGAGFAVAAYDPEMFDRQTLAVVMAWLYGVIVACVALCGWREYRGSGDRSRRRREPSQPQPAVPESDAD